MSRSQKILFSGLLLISLAIAGRSAVSLVQAQTIDDLGVSYASSTGLSAQDPRITIARIIQIGLGLLGTIAVVLVIYAGFLWMTAAGNEDKIKRAKDVLKAAVIGLVIILSAFAIVSFVLNNLTQAINGPGGPGGPGGPIDPIVPSGNFLLTGVSPANNATGLPRNTIIRFQFNGSVDASTINNTNASVISAGNPVDGQWLVSGREIVFQPANICQGSCGEVNCLPENGEIIVQLNTEIKSVGSNPKPLTCDGLGVACNLSFSTGSTIDCQNPQAEFITNIGLCSGVSNNIKVLASDDSGLARFELLADGQSVDLTTGSFGSEHLFSTNWTPLSTAGTNFNLQALVDDIAGRRTTVQQNGQLLPTHCCNGQKDGDEIGIDCGGSCLNCHGAACANDQQLPTSSCNNNLCQSGFCTQQGSDADACLAAGYPAGTTDCCLCKNQPKITGLTPRGGFCLNNPNQYCLTDEQCGSDGVCDIDLPNAKAGNLMTIFGSGFGSSIGSVIFTDSQLGNLSVCGSNAWLDNQIIVQVPTGVTSGKIQVKNSDNFIATSSQEVVINNISRPGLCSLSQTSATTNELIDYLGINFSPGGGVSAMALYGDLFNPIPTNESETISQTLLRARVPSLQPGQVTTFVRHESGSLLGPASNFLLFNKLVDPGSQPQITSFSPISGPPGQYVTIYGQGFGNIRGTSQVFFGTTEANYQFPEECSDSVWSDRQIIVKVPGSLIGNSSQLISVKLGDGQDLLASEPFAVNTNALNPSICRINPTIGRVGSQIEIWGEYFRSHSPASSRLRFNPNINIGSINWFDNGVLSGASSTVPSGAITGPVQVINSSGVSNSFNFRVGACQSNSDCPGQICCPAASPDGGQCQDSLADCYGSVASCVYRWSFTTGSGNNSCPEGTTMCGSQCCNNDNQTCFDNICQNNELLSCNNYHQCDGALYCPNSPGWCSQQAGSTIGGQCGDDYCRTLFDKQGVLTEKTMYFNTVNYCLNKDQACDLSKMVDFQLGQNQVSYQLRCQNKRWTTSLTAGQCPPTTEEYGGWQLLVNNICQSEKECSDCANPLKCLITEEDESYCGLDQKICATGFQCDGQNCQSPTGSCECCCDQNLNNDQGNPGCCAPLTCAGTCGSGSSADGSKTFGFCSGCAMVGSSVIERDAACNCLGSTGKYCDTSTTNGRCGDCAQLSEGDCINHSTCCFDGKTGQCRGAIDNNRLEDGYCGYYNCDGNFCASELKPTGLFTTAAACEAGCRVISLQGQSCDIATTSASGAYVQQIGCGYQFCSAPLSCRVADGLSSTSTNQADCGICCCDPVNDQCSQLSLNLSCVADRGQCTGSGRGLCCGCQSDAECGDSQNNGCGSDTCCQARPVLKNVLPANNTNGVCRNGLIKATFSQPLDQASLASNILLIADYGTDQQCPIGTSYLALGQFSNNWWFKLRYRLLAWLRPAVIAEEPNPSHTYCAVAQSANMVDKDLVIKPNSVLPANRRFFVVMIADSNLNDHQAEGLLSQAGIGLANGQPLKFNNLKINSALQWSFKTGDQICRIDHIEISPASLLLSDLQASSTLTASAIGFSGQVLSPSSAYNWDWQWSVGNLAVAQLETNNDQAIVRPQNKKDAETYVRATAQVQVDQTSSGGPLPNFYKDAAIRVFLCANPWPARKADGSWSPWTDYATNMQFYYCRDGQDNTQSTDLPGLKVVSSTDPAAINPAFYFFQYSPATTSPTNLSATSVPTGGSIRLTWNAYPSAVGYKVYYGLSSGRYFSDPINIPKGQIETTINGLINGQRYYIAVSAILQIDQTTLVETPLSSEITETPLDRVAPQAVRCLKQAIGLNKIDLQWLRNLDDTVAYRVEYRAKNALGAGQVMIINQPLTGNKITAVISGLISPSQINVEVKAVDAAGNISSVQNPIVEGC